MSRFRAKARRAPGTIVIPRWIFARDRAGFEHDDFATWRIGIGSRLLVFGCYSPGLWWFRVPLLGGRGLWHKDRARRRLYYSERNWIRPFDFAVGTRHFRFLGKAETK